MKASNWNLALSLLTAHYPDIDTAPLGLSLVANSHRGGEQPPVRAKRGESGITSHGKKLVRNGCKTLQDTAGRQNLTFWTVTLPNVSKRDAETIAENWANIVRVLMQRLGRMLRKAGLPAISVGVTEVQAKRFASSGVLCLHLHVVFQGRHRFRSWAYSPEDFDRCWKEVLAPYLELTQDEYEWSASSNVQRVKRSAEGYLGKYMSKGKEDCRLYREAGYTGVFPSSWYTISNSLRRAVLRAKVSIFQELGEWLRECVYRCPDDVFEYVREIKIDITNGWHPPMEKMEKVIGWCGRLKQSTTKEIYRTVNKVV